ncbi:MAG TPA: hypothetical protein VGX96_13270 [Candidatus Elarobacter sp.]|jgi:hypothetical protein|nr:hypothetical protein [Candidatus Elarobacter sp.]
MEYVAILRARRILTWYAIVIVAIGALGLALALKDGSPKVTNSSIPFIGLVIGSMLGPVILASFFAIGLDDEHRTLAIAWTRPIARLAIAWRYVAVAFVGMLASWIFTLAVALAALAVLGLARYIEPGSQSWTSIPLILGVAVMWYGLVLFVSAVFPGHPARIAGASWAYALIVPALTHVPFPPLLHQVTVALNYLNPLSYLQSSSRPGGDMVFANGMAGMYVAWAIGIACVVAGTYLWANREVKA